MPKIGVSHALACRLQSRGMRGDLMPHLYTAVSGHGLGHLGQVSPVINQLVQAMPELRLTVQSALPRSKVESRIAAPFELVPEPPDIGMLMQGPLITLFDASLRAHERFHSTWDMRVDQQIALFERLRPDLILADVPYLPLLAAKIACIPAVALCSLNWAGILSVYGRGQLADRLVRCMLDAYASAQVFIRPTPAMPMPELTNTLSVGPIATLGQDRRQEIRKKLGVGIGVRLVLVSFGGIEMGTKMQCPNLTNVRWLLPRTWGGRRADCHAVDDLGVPFVDILRSADLVVTKPGYGTFVESACNGTAVLYVARPDWPESPYLEGWLHENARARKICFESLCGSVFGDAVEALLGESSKPVPAPSGTAAAANLLESLFSDHR